jgi:hypothetical protein
MPKKNDNIVGESQGPILNGGHQTGQQAEIVNQGGGGKTDAERRQEWSGSDAREGRADPAIGGSSGGHSDQMAARGPREDRKIAGGLYETEQTQGTGKSEAKPQKRPT